MPRAQRLPGCGARPPRAPRPRPWSSALGAREVEHARARLQPLRALHLERLAQAALEEPELVVRVQAVALGGQQLLDHRILARWELDHQRAAERGQPVDELL